MQTNKIKRMVQQGVPLSYAEGNVELIRQDGLYFKNLSRSGRLEIYEDWRRSPEERAVDLAGRLSVEQMAGLMVFSLTVTIPADDRRQIHSRSHTYNQKSFAESGAPKSALSDQVKQMLIQESIRAFYVGGIENTADMVDWVNNVQDLAERQPLGIPVCLGSDPRHGINSKMRHAFEPGESISIWPDGIGMAALYDRELVRQASRIQAQEYRAMGMTHLIGPQMDLTTDPRWSRYGESLGVNTKLVIDLSRACIEGFQISEQEEDGWGRDSVICIAKHFPGGATGEGGRDAHYNYGKFAVYPGNNLQEHLSVFRHGALGSKRKAGNAASVMPYYSIPFGQDGKNRENVATGFSSYFLTDLLTGEYGFDGVICSDWEIITDQGQWVNEFAGKCWGAEEDTPGRRVYRSMKAGMNQFGGINTAEQIRGGFQVACQEEGEAAATALLRESCRKILRNMFRIRLFDDPYLDPAATAAIHHNPTSIDLGKQAQRKSVVMLKNKGGVLPVRRASRLYIARKPGCGERPGESEALGKRYELVDRPEQADFAVVFLNEPKPASKAAGSMGNYNRGYDIEDYRAGGNGYVPISLQYGPYTAEKARPASLAAVDPMDGCDRSYRGKTIVNDASDLELLRATRAAMGSKPVIVVLKLRNPCCVHQLEPLADAILLDMWLEKDIIGDILAGDFEPQGLLPFPMPLDMDAVECHCEDVGTDIPPYVDDQGNAYDVAFGLGFHGPIQDERVKHYQLASKGNE